MANSSNATNAVASPTTAAVNMLAANASRISALLRNQGTVAVYVGFSAGVTSSNGLLLAVGDVLSLNNYTGDIFGITASGTGSVAVSEFRP